MNTFETLYHLTDNPFDPEVDKKRQLDFREERLSLARELDVFKKQNLQPYYIRAGIFDEALRDLDNYLATKNYQGFRPAPVVMIQGRGGTGLSTLMHEASLAIRERCGKVIVERRTIKVIGDHFGKVLLRARNTLQRHLLAKKIEGTEQIVEEFPITAIKSDDPDEGTLMDFFVNLADNIEGEPPPFILIVDSLRYQHHDWMKRLYDLLAPLNVSLILLTADTNIRRLFDQHVDKHTIDGVSLRLRELEPNEIMAFLAARLDDFRVDNTPEKLRGIFPFAENVLNEKFQARDSRTVKIIITTCKVALERKLAAASAGGNEPDPLVGPKDLTDSYQSALRSVPTRD